MIDFNKLSRPSSASAPLDPEEIFARTPNLKDAPNDLWKGQAEALKRWHVRRTDTDSIITLNTGAGKSIVGLLIAQSLINEAIGPVVFACSTIDLVQQTSKECTRLGIKYTERVRGSFSNDLYETGRAFCITTYQALFSPINAFKGQNAPEGLIFDDAHVAERLIRDSFTLSISYKEFPNLFNALINIIRPEFVRVNKGPHFEYILADAGQQRVTLCPPTTGHRCRSQIITALQSADFKKNSLFFPTSQLFQNFQHCAIFVSSNQIEITPPFIPTGIFSFLGAKKRRVYLSATLEYDTEFVRGFGRKVKTRIDPDNDAGNGERLILLQSELDPKTDKLALARSILAKQKLLISVPTYPKAKPWESIATPVSRENFSAALNEFRAARSGAFILVSRIDGIDLPQDTCRVMLVDGAPSGSSLMEHYLFSQLSMSNLYSTKMAARITQLFGRINRGRSDYGVFIVCGKDVISWIKTERNVALLPPLIRKQVILGQSLQQDIGPSKSEDVAKLVDQVLNRDVGWLDFYRDTIEGLEVSSEALARVKEREALLANSALAECKFMTHLWQGDLEGARKELLDVLDDTASADARLAGWYSLWLGMSYECENDMETSVAHYRRARARLSHWLNVPLRTEAEAAAVPNGPKTLIQDRLLSVNHRGPQPLGDLIRHLEGHINNLANEQCTSNQHEEALRSFGEAIGYRACRPDNEIGVGPDVLWVDEEGKELLAFELKTLKVAPVNYNKEDVGQAHNHSQWLVDEYKSFQCHGLLIVGPAGTCTKAASPSETIFFLDTGEMLKRLSEFVAKIEDTRGRTAIDRWTALEELGALPEWQLTGWFKAFATKPMSALKEPS